MAFCGKCGAQLTEGTAFCASCGTPVAGAAGGTPTPAAVGAPMSANVAGLLAYVLGFVTGIIFLVVEPYKNDKFVRFHAFQSIFFTVAVFVFWVAFSVLSAALGLVSFGIMGALMALIGLLISLLLMVYWIFLMYKAYSNERYMIPFIGQLAAKQAG